MLFSITFFYQFRMGLGRVWGPFGKGLVRSGAPLGRSWAPLGRFGGVQNRFFFKQWSKLVSKRPQGSILEGFGEGFGRVSGDLGRVWGGSWDGSWPSWEAWSRISISSLAHAVCLLLHHILLQEPPRCLATLRGASQSARPLGEGVLDLPAMPFACQ